MSWDRTPSIRLQSAFEAICEIPPELKTSQYLSSSIYSARVDTLPCPRHDFPLAALHTPMAKRGGVLHLPVGLKCPEGQKYKRNRVVFQKGIWRQNVSPMECVEDVNCLLFGAFWHYCIGMSVSCTKGVYLVQNSLQVMLK